MALSKSQVGKILRKQKRCQILISKETGLESSNFPTQYIAVCNAGLSTGLQEEILLKEVTHYGNILNLIMLPKKSYCFLECSDLESSKNIFEGIHGKTKLGQSGATLYLSYFNSLPQQYSNCEYMIPPGVIVLNDFVNEKEENQILCLLKDSEENENSLKHRIVKHYGYEFLYNSNQVDSNKPIDRKIPDELNFLWQNLREKNLNLNWYEPDQLTVNVYKVGQGIPPHVDTHSAFLDPIMSLSLEDDVVMEFRKLDKKYLVLLPRRSLLIMSGESRYDWTHGIRSRVMDVIQTRNNTLTVRQRKQRTSLTFRKLHRGSCCCSFENFCDSKLKEKEENKNKLASSASILEIANVHDVYEEIATHFSETRHSPWPLVEDFIKTFQIGDVLLDIGCGNGKYLNISNNIVNIGCDRSERLLKLCTQKKFNVFKCDCLSIPFRNESVDGCLNIAVIHHLASQERRLQAIKEMARILKPRSKGLIYVWSRNQSADSKKSSYLRQNKNAQKNKIKEEEELRTQNIKPKTATKINLPIHKNRTEFKEQDILVPWKLKTAENKIEGENIYLRYYHVFEKNELEDLCKSINTIEIIKSYYDQGNWCIIFEKKKLELVSE